MQSWLISLYTSLTIKIFQLQNTWIQSCLGLCQDRHLWGLEGPFWHFCSFWRGKSTWLLGQFAQLGFMTFLYLAEIFPRRWRPDFCFLREPVQRNEESMTLLRAPAISDTLWEWGQLLVNGLSCWVLCLGQERVKVRVWVPFLTTPTGLLILFFFFIALEGWQNVKYFSHLLIFISESICSEWWAHKIIAL